MTPSYPVDDAARADRALERLGALHPKLIDLSLDRVWRLLAALGNPQDRLPPVIHLAGTNGKGSTQAFLRAGLQAAGLRVHAYTSPHLVRFNERITLAGEDISDRALADLLERIEEVNEGQPITFFEVTTCAAFAAFADVAADVVLLETGLGGRLDATNVLDHPLASILTPIAMDHEQFLGNSLEGIAWEKAHIIKAGVPAFSAQQTAEAAAVLAQRSRDVGTSLTAAGSDFAASRLADQPGVWQFSRKGKPTWTLPVPSLPGPHQVHNAALALAVLCHLAETKALPGFAPEVNGETPPEALITGLQTVRWPARMQRLTRGPLAEMLPPDWELWLDGAHNPHAGQMLAEALDGWKAEDPDRPTDLIMGMMGPKDAEGFFRPLAPRVARLRTVPVPEEQNAKLPEVVAVAAQNAGFKDIAVCEDVTAALQNLLFLAPVAPARRIMICGSLYLAGSVLRENG